MNELIHKSLPVRGDVWRHRDLDALLDALEQFAVELETVINDQSVETRGFDLEIHIVKVPRKCKPVPA